MTTMRAAKEIQYRAELVAISVPVRMLAMEPTAEMVLKPWAGKQSRAYTMYRTDRATPAQTAPFSRRRP